MGRNRVVVPATDRINISDGDWIEVKRELNTGDQKRVDSCGLKPPVLLNERIYRPVDWGLFEMEKALVWLTEWSITGTDGKVLELNLDSVMSLEQETFNEINDAITMHKQKQAEAKNSLRAPKAPTPEPNTSMPASPDSEPKSS